MDNMQQSQQVPIVKGYDCNIIGVPKTIDNDLYGTDHCPIRQCGEICCTTFMELCLDAKVYDIPKSQ